jgi:hypothetical protein
MQVTVRQKQKIYHSILLSLAFLGFAPFVLGIAPGTSCVDDGTYCNFYSQPLNAMLKPYTVVLGSWTYVVIWGAMLGTLWLWTESPGIVAIVGIVAGGFISQAVDPKIFYIGYLLVAISIGIYLFAIFSKAQYS